jgi:hypothetical protein
MLSDVLALVATIDPQLQPQGDLDSPWISISDFNQYLAVLSVGAFGADATVDAKLVQAQDAEGTNAKDLGIAITQLAAAGGSKQAMLNFNFQNVDPDGTFTFVGLRIMVGGAATFVAASIFGSQPRYPSLQCVDLDAASLVQSV